MAEGNKNQWVIWTIVVGAIIVTLIAFNYQGGKSEVVPLSEIFPDEFESIEYEYITEDPVEQARAPQAPAPSAPAASSSRTGTRTQPVAQQRQARETAPSTTTILSNQQPFYTIQALSSKNKVSTESALKKLKAGKYPNAFIAADNVGERGTWYRIYIGQFSKKSQADQFLSKVRQDYKDCFVKFIKK